MLTGRDADSDRPVSRLPQAAQVVVCPLHPERLFVACSHYCELVSQPEQVQRLARIAVQRAIGDNGVAVLVLPGDVLDVKAAHLTMVALGEDEKPALLPTLEPDTREDERRRRDANHRREVRLAAPGELRRVTP